MITDKQSRARDPLPPAGLLPASVVRMLQCAAAEVDYRKRKQEIARATQVAMEMCSNAYRQ